MSISLKRTRLLLIVSKISCQTTAITLSTWTLTEINLLSSFDGPRADVLRHFRGAECSPQVYRQFFVLFFLFKRMYIPRCLRGWLSTLFENRKPDGRSIPTAPGHGIEIRVCIYVYMCGECILSVYIHIIYTCTARGRSWWNVISIRRRSSG